MWFKKKRQHYYIALNHLGARAFISLAECDRLVLYPIILMRVCRSPAPLQQEYIRPRSLVTLIMVMLVSREIAPFERSLDSG